MILIDNPMGNINMLIVIQFWNSDNILFKLYWVGMKYLKWLKVLRIIECELLILELK